MANRYLEQFIYSQVKKLVYIHTEFTTGAAGIVNAGSVKGSLVTSITKTGTGLYEILLDDKYAKLLSLSHAVFQNLAGNSNVAAVEVVGDVQTSIQSATPKVTIQCLDFAGAAVNPTTGITLMIDLMLRNSSIAGKNE